MLALEMTVQGRSKDGLQSRSGTQDATMLKMQIRADPLRLYGRLIMPYSVRSILKRYCLRDED